MIEPTGYTALDLIGFTDRGAYDPTATYVKNDIVTVGNTKWRCKVDDTIGITPTEGANWTIYLESATSLAGMDDTDITSPKDGDLIQFNSTSNKWKNSADVWDTMAQNGAHNLLPNSLTTQVINGVTFTVNSDKSITISGSPTTLVAPIVGANFTIPKGQYILSGIDSSVTNMMWNAIVLLNGASVVHTYTISSADDFSFDTSEYTYTNIQVSMKRIEDNVACSGTIYPMIRLASDPNKEYTPHAKTNRELSITDKDFFTGNSALTFDVKRSYRFGNVCELDIEVVLPSSGNVTLGTLSRNIPSGTVYSVAYVGSGTGARMAQIKNDGSVTLYGAEAARAYLNFTYILG